MSPRAGHGPVRGPGRNAAARGCLAGAAGLAGAWPGSPWCWRLSPAYAQEPAAPGTATAADKAVQEALNPPKVPPEPDGYRTDEYRAPTPATLRGATVLDTDDRGQALARQGGAVHRRHAARREAGEPSRRHASGATRSATTFPAACGCPMSAMACSNAQVDGYFRGGLESVTEGRHDAPLWCSTARPTAG